MQFVVVETRHIDVGGQTLPIVTIDAHQRLYPVAPVRDLEIRVEYLPLAVRQRLS